MDPPGVNKLPVAMVAGCKCLPQFSRNSRQLTPPSIVKMMFKEASRGKNFMNAADLASFLETVQGEKGMDEAKAASMITQTVLSAIAGFHFSISVQSVQLDLQGFLSYLVNARLNPAMITADEPTQDMTGPLSHYYIYSSHNSYLTGNQLTSRSSTAPIAEALRGGCRVIELDCWEKRGRIMVLHGNTLTRAVAFKDCVAAIKDNAFLASDYPVIITIENHLGAELQKKAATVLREVLGDRLFYPSKEQRPPVQFQSPESLKGFIIVSDKPPSDTVEDQVADDPEAAGNLVDDEFDDASNQNPVTSQKATKIKKHLKRAQKKTFLKVVNTAANVFRHSVMVDKIVIPKTIEFEELIYIYCAKPSEMKEKQVKGGPLVSGDRAIMANLSEPQLRNFVNKHPGSILEYSKVNLGRVYPFGLRFDSSNADPMVAWSHGFQMAAINMQGKDRPVWVAKGFFQANGNTGYVKKPNLFLPGSPYSYEEIANLPPKIILRVTVLLGTNWHRNFDYCKMPDFYVKAAVHGMTSDNNKKQTQVVYNSNEPHWETEHFEFPLRVPEIAVLRLECWEWDMGNDDFVGQACIPVQEMRYGVRTVALRSKAGTLHSSKLLCHFESLTVFATQSTFTTVMAAPQAEAASASDPPKSSSLPE